MHGHGGSGSSVHNTEDNHNISSQFGWDHEHIILCAAQAEWWFQGFSLKLFERKLGPVNLYWFYWSLIQYLDMKLSFISFIWAWFDPKMRSANRMYFATKIRALEQFFNWVAKGRVLYFTIFVSFLWRVPQLFPFKPPNTRYTSPVCSVPSPSFVTVLFIILNPDSICCVSLVNIYNILHKCVMTSQFPRHQLFHDKVSREMDKS